MSTRGKGNPRSARRQSTNGIAAPVVVVSEPGLHAVEPQAAVSGARVCDLKGCGQPGAAVIDLNVENYTGRAGDQLTLAICADHGAQYKAGAIAGFAWTPVYKTELGMLPGTKRPEPQKEQSTNG